MTHNTEITPEKAHSLLSDALSRHIEDESERKEFLDSTIREFLGNLSQIEKTGGDVDLLEEMINRGFFPSFSFPLDVAAFTVLGTKKKGDGGPWTSPHTWASTSQDLKVALSEFAPGRKITVNKQTYQVGGIGINFPINPINHLEELWLAEPHWEINEESGEKQVAERADEDGWRFFHRCVVPECGVIFKSTNPSFNLNGDETCPACSAVGDGNNGEVVSSRMVTPEVFRPIMKPYKNGIFYSNTDDWINNSGIEMRGEEFSYENSARHRIGKASLPTPLTDWQDEGFYPKWDGGDQWTGLRLLSIIDAEDIGKATRLLNVNEGPNQWASEEGASVKGNGFRICCKCGHVALKKVGNFHHRPYAITRDKVGIYVNTVLELSGEEAKSMIEQQMGNAKSKCSGAHSEHIVLGHEFRTDIVVLRFPVKEPLTSNWNTAFFDGAVRAIKEALITEVTSALKLMDREIGGNYRKVVLPRADETESKDKFIDIFLYDQVSGGAGLVSRIEEDLDNNPENGIEFILDRVQERLGGKYCGKGNQPCQRVCTCLMDFRNKMEHDRMSRPLGLQLLEFMRNGTPPSVDYFTTVEGFEGATNTESLVEQLTQVFLASPISISGPDNEGIVEITKDILSLQTERRKIKPYSILAGSTSFPEENPLIWDAVPSQQHRLDDEVIHIPYELLRDAPHILNEIVFPAQNGVNPDQPEGLFDGM